jgi:hypothetical protein
MQNDRPSKGNDNHFVERQLEMVCLKNNKGFIIETRQFYARTRILGFRKIKAKINSKFFQIKIPLVKSFTFLNAFKT